MDQGNGVIISHEHRYIFLHCRKTAGSSIAVSLSRFLGPRDIVLSAIEEILEMGYSLPEATREIARTTTRKRSIRGKSVEFLRYKGVFGDRSRHYEIKKKIKSHFVPALGSRPEHAFAVDVKNQFPFEWNNYSKFCVVRNPWSKVVSDYYWTTKGLKTPPTFIDFVRALEKGDDLGGIIPIRHHNNWPLYTIDDEIAVDAVIRFEDLSNGLEKTCATFGIPYDGWLPRAKGKIRPKSGSSDDLSTLYTPELRDAVGHIFEKEIETFGYTFKLEATA